MFVPPSVSLVTGYKMKSFFHKFVPAGAKFIACALNPEDWDVELYDLDAKFANYSTSIEDLVTKIPEIYYEDLAVSYIKGLHKNDLLSEIISELCKGLEKYDYILCSNQRNPTFEIPVKAGNNFNLILLHFLSQNSPKALRILGGKRNFYYDFESLKAKGLILEELFDVVVYEDIAYEEIEDLLALRHYSSANNVYDLTGSFVQVPRKVRIAEPSIDYPEIRPILKNQQDLRYSYEKIYRDLMLKIPDETKKTNYIQQVCFHYIGGCISKCAFCVSAVHPPSPMSFEKTTDRMRALIEDCGYNSFFFLNNTLNSNRKLVDRLCNWIVSNNYKIMWSDSCRLSGNGPDFYKMLFEAGCRKLNFGVDSGSNKILKYIRKGSTIEEMSKELQWCHEANIWNLVNVISGYPFETEEDLDLTLDFLRDHKEYINVFKFNVFHLEAQSPFHLQADRFDLLVESNEEILKNTAEQSAQAEIVFHEKNGRTYEEINRFRKEVVLKKGKESEELRTDRFMTHIGQHLLFSLYEMLGNKVQIQSWLKKNYPQGRNAYYEFYKDHPKIESWSSDFTLDTHFSTKDLKPVFPGWEKVSAWYTGDSPQPPTD